MATKASIGGKRKAAPAGKGKADHKKARLETKAVSSEDPTSDNDSSDSDDGGAALPPRALKKIEADSKGKVFEKGQTSRESHAKQKQLAQERKAAKPLADEVQRTKKIWERLRRKSHVPRDERKTLVDELFGIITGRVRDFVLKHDAVRAVQTAIKYSTAEQRKQIARELQGTYPQLAESRYAKFMIAKLLVQNDGEVRDMIIPEFYGKVRKLIHHPEASWILDDIYRTVATKEQKASLLREWYGPEFTLKEMTRDTKTTADLNEILSNDPNKRGPIMKNLLDMINSLIQKKMTGFTMLHDAMMQYFSATQAGTEEFTEFFEIVKGDEGGDLLKNLAFTKSGSRLVCLLLAYGAAKDRKQLLKAYKDTFTMMAGDTHAHVVILTAYDVIDDTKLTSKSIFPELVGEKEEDVTQNIISTANQTYARTVFLYPFIGLSKSLFPAESSFATDVLKEVHEIRKTTSKKDEQVRRAELVTALSPHLLDAITAAAPDLVSTAFGCQFVTEVLLGGSGDKEKALAAVAECAAGDPNEQIEGEAAQSPKLHLSHSAAAGRMLKSLIQGGRYDKEKGQVVQVEPPLNFSNQLYPVIEEHVVTWATGPGSFVVVALVEASDFTEQKALVKKLKEKKKTLQKAASEETAEQKAARESQEQSTAGKKGKKKGEKPVGNAGSKILLEKLR
jgi:pumilio family protein 6